MDLWSHTSKKEIFLALANGFQLLSIAKKIFILDSFSAVTSTNVGTSLQNFLTFNFNPFSTLEFVPSPSLKSLNLKQDHP